MWKKIGIGLLVAVVTLTTFVYVRLDTAQKEIAQLLDRYDISLEALNIGLFPPALKLQHLKFTHPDVQALVNSAEVEFNPLFLAVGKLRIEDIRLNDGVVYKGGERATEPDYQAINLSLKPTALYADDLPELFRFAKNNQLSEDLANRFAPQISFSGQNRQDDKIELFVASRIAPNQVAFSPLKITLNLAKPAYQNQQQFDLSIDKGVFSNALNGEGYQILADGWRINGENLGLTKGEIHSSKSLYKNYVATLTTNACNGCTTIIELEKTASKRRKFSLHTEYFPLEKLLKAFQLPVFATGTGAIVAELEFSGLQPENGRFFINTLDGNIQGLDILQIVGQYLPINYNTDNEMKTDYKQFIARFNWNKNSLDIDEIYFQNKELLINGKGEVELDEMQCEIALTIGVNEPKYKNLTLPMRFFDDCYSPQYKIDVNKNLRENLKDYIKQRIKD